MRPVRRGGQPGKYTDHPLAKGDLMRAIGAYCSYCERPFPEDVEHVLPKLEYPNLRLHWGNFLLACKSCNDTKKNQQIMVSPPASRIDRWAYLWPDTDNTARAFVYSRTEISVALGLGPLTPLAEATRKMTGFHKTPGSPNPPDSPKDHRWEFRDAQWVLAERYRAKMAAEPANLSLREAAADLAAGNGFWSVWRTVFAGDADMLRRLNEAFAGTAPCFDPTTLQPSTRGRL